MQISVETTGQLGRRLNISVPADQFDRKFKEHVEKVAKTAKIDGFRPGKVPLNVIEKRLGDSIRQEVLNEILQSSLYEALTQEKLQPAGRPSIEIKKFEPNQPIEYSATFEIYPTIELADFNKIEFEKTLSEVADQDIDQMIEILRKQRVTWEKVDRAAKNEDRVMIDFEGFMDGKTFKGGEAKQFPLVLGSHSMIPGFEEGIEGLKANDKKEVQVTFPKDYPHKDFAGKEATFNILVHEVQQPELPALDDEFLKQLGVEKGGMDKLREDLKMVMERELQTTLKAINKMSVMEQLLKTHQFEMPQDLINMEMDQLHQQAVTRAKQYNKNKEPEISKDIFKEQAIRRVKLGLILAEYIKTHQLKPDADKVRQTIQDLVRLYPDSEKMIKEIYANRQQLNSVEMLVLEDQIVDKLLESDKVKEKHLNYEEVMQQKVAHAS